jgi:beta-lactam-binding protein with PASTA domain
MRNFFSYFKTPAFFINLLIILLVIAGSFFGVVKWLDSYTKHGEFVVVPDFTGKKILRLDEFIRDKDVTFEVIDSIYDPSEKAGIVLRQDPEPSSKVKHNRTVYLYVTGLVPPQIKMPQLRDRSERQARLILATYGLKVHNITYQEADCNGCVLTQLYHGREIEPGANIKKGSVVDLVVGRKDAYIGQHQVDTTDIESEFEN